MPPQQTNLTSETGREVAGLRFDPGIALVKVAPGNASAEARPDLRRSAERRFLGKGSGRTTSRINAERLEFA